MLSNLVLLLLSWKISLIYGLSCYLVCWLLYLGVVAFSCWCFVVCIVCLYLTCLIKGIVYLLLVLKKDIQGRFESKPCSSDSMLNRILCYKWGLKSAMYTTLWTRDWCVLWRRITESLVLLDILWCSIIIKAWWICCFITQLWHVAVIAWQC